jgi:superfamily II DNA/RNA helicase
MSKHPFEELGIDEDFNPFYQEAGITKPNAVQMKVIPKMMEKKDILVVAQTGTGKTLSYALPISELIKQIEDENGPTQKRSKPLALILVPTKELAVQIESVFKEISHHVKLRTRSLVGGQRNKATKTLTEQCYEILVATPNKLTQALNKKEVSLLNLQFLVFDESDTLFDMGFKKDIETILNRAPIENVTVSLFSATLPVEVEVFLKQQLATKNLEKVTFASGHKVQQKIETFNLFVSPKEKLNVLKMFFDKTAQGRGIVFANQKNHVSDIDTFLKENCPKLKYKILHGDLEQKERLANHKAFVDQKVQVLVATDVAARGIDIKDLAWVLNFGLPKTAEFYLHRCGRTGRAGQKGQVFNLVTDFDAKLIAHINNSIKSQSALDLDFIREDIKKTAGKLNKPKKKVAKKTKRVKITKRTKRI